MELGTWADWVSGLGTAGSLLLGFRILARDRRKEERAEASRVVAWFVNEVNGNVTLTVRNGAERPIVHVMFTRAVIGEHNKTDLVKMLSLAPILLPGANVSMTLPFAEFHANPTHPSYVEFRDSSGIQWRRNVRSSRLRRAPAPLHFRPLRFLLLLRSPRRALTYAKATLSQR